MEIDRREFLTGLAITTAATSLPAIPMHATVFERLGIATDQQERAIELARRALRAWAKEQLTRSN